MIREDGIEKLLSSYKRVNKKMIENGEKKEEVMLKVLKEIEKEEREVLKRKINREERKKEKIERVSERYRSEERSIGIESEGWERRYKRIQESNGRSYKEMLDWIWEYYQGKAKEEKSYNGKGGPLIREIINEEGESSKKKTKEYSVDYVIPKEHKVRLTKEIEEKIKNKKEEPMEFNWNFKKYFWESELL